MIDLLITLLRILFPLDPVARLREITRNYINAMVSCLEDQLRRETIAATPHLRAKLEADIAALEHGINLLIHERARQILGLPYIYTPRIPSPHQRRARPLPQIVARLSRMAALFHNMERLAQRRAQRMQRELADNPLGLAPSAQSTSPMLRMVEDFVIMREVLHRRRRGRWIARSCAQDGGGERRRRRRDLIQWIKSRSERLSVSEGRVLPRGPPNIPMSKIKPLASVAPRLRSPPFTPTPTQTGRPKAAR